MNSLSGRGRTDSPLQLSRSYAVLAWTALLCFTDWLVVLPTARLQLPMALNTTVLRIQARRLLGELSSLTGMWHLWTEEERRMLCVLRPSRRAHCYSLKVFHLETVQIPAYCIFCSGLIYWTCPCKEGGHPNCVPHPCTTASRTLCLGFVLMTSV